MNFDCHDPLKMELGSHVSDAASLAAGQTGLSVHVQRNWKKKELPVVYSSHMNIFYRPY